MSKVGKRTIHAVYLCTVPKLSRYKYVIILQDGRFYIAMCGVWLVKGYRIFMILFVAIDMYDSRERRVFLCCVYSVSLICTEIGGTS